ncbi:NADH-quinone oxidoreductase subunit I [Humibacillus sp. DSM 29435]|uniref:NADH-quinone oxidoreductase subunit A n=1 Tax=Humibacillus sp. DSM 29435 TaxID=1869167 RepID=UPI0008727AA5|nr:NADH-quinone oxidoreductase subunit A [Humibacillus sp. DSM 29435]OFE17192.1 NADH-quinone oxidoreductase subunit I [Humibacillus sp. DSM 29435]
MYVAPLVVIVVAAVSLTGLWGLHRMTAVSPEPLKVLPFQSGWCPQEHALSRYHARWYLATLVFLAFDVEMLFMYPWAVVVADVGASAVIEMFLFLGALLLAVVWAWREGALRWA